MQGREVHRMAGEQRSNGAPRADVPEQQGGGARHVHGAKKGGKCGEAQKALGGELTAEMCKRRRQGHQGTKEARVSHKDETKEVVKRVDQRRRIERRQGSDGT